jgi:hypothetical protein
MRGILRKWAPHPPIRPTDHYPAIAQRIPVYADLCLPLCILLGKMRIAVKGINTLDQKS